MYIYICIKSKLNSPTQKRVNKKFRNKSNRKTKSMKCFAKEKIIYIDREKKAEINKVRSEREVITIVYRNNGNTVNICILQN